ALLALFEGRVDDVLTVDQADANPRDGLLERDLRHREGCRRAGQSQDVGVVLGIRREDERDDLRLVPPARREERSDGAVDDAARQALLFGGFAFPLEEASRYAAGRVGVLAIVDGQGEEVDSLSRALGAACRDKYDRVAGPDDDGAARLFRKLAGF